VIRYMVIQSVVKRPGEYPVVVIVDYNIGTLEEATAEREWFVETNETAEPENVKIVEYRE
jgi:hypothetical protein